MMRQEDAVKHHRLCQEGGESEGEGRTRGKDNVLQNSSEKNGMKGSRGGGREGEGK